jgi:glycosyltransferase involved in cell wall biosynthesis
MAVMSSYLSVSQFKGNALSARLLFVIGSLDVGGAERHLLQILPPLAQHGFELTVFTIIKKGKLAPPLVEFGVRVVEPWFATSLRSFPSILIKPLLLFSAVFSYGFLLLRWRPSIIHFFLPTAYLLGGLCSLVLGRRIFVMSRRSLNRYQTKSPSLAKVEKWLHGRMNAVLGNSAAVVRELREEGVVESRLGLLYNGIDMVPFDKLPPRSSIRNSLGVGDGVFLMVCVANLIPYKGHVDLVRALSNIRDSLPADWAIAMVGRDSGNGRELERLAENLGVAGHILWLGERNDAIEIYSAADIGVLCSHQEGFSNSVLEGMAANLAMVVTDVGGNAEAVLDGECGIVVPAREPEVLGRAILTLAKDGEMRRRMAASGCRRAKQEFSVGICVGRYASLYRALLREPGCHIQTAINEFQDGVSPSGSQDCFSQR